LGGGRKNDQKESTDRKTQKEQQQRREEFRVWGTWSPASPSKKKRVKEKDSGRKSDSLPQGLLHKKKTKYLVIRREGGRGVGKLIRPESTRLEEMASSSSETPSVASNQIRETLEKKRRNRKCTFIW